MNLLVQVGLTFSTKLNQGLTFSTKLNQLELKTEIGSFCFKLVYFGLTFSTKLNQNKPTWT